MNRRTPARFESCTAVVMCMILIFLASPGRAQSTPPGQSPLKGTPHLFGPGVISTPDQEAMASFSPDGKTVYFCKYNPGWFHNTIVVSHRKGERWMTPEVASFSGQWSDASPYVTPDGSKLFFASNRPVDGSKTERDDGDLWYVERTASGAWGEPKHISGPVNSEGDENYPSVTKDGTLYFASTRATEHFSAGQPHIYRSRLVNGEYSAPELMPWTSAADDHMPTVAFDDSFMIFFSGGRGGLGGGDLFVSFHRADGTWSNPKNLGSPINSGDYEMAPRLSPDNHTLYFASNRIDGPSTRTRRVNYHELEQELHAIQNGLNNIYEVDITDLRVLDDGK